jgi:hypothetical protein
VLIKTVTAGEDTDVALFAIKNEGGIVVIAPEAKESETLGATRLFLQSDFTAE